MKTIAAGKPMWASPLFFVLIVQTLLARTLFVPEAYPTINSAISESIAEDTILVNRGVYPEQIWFPSHRISVMSYYELTGDTLDCQQTIIEGYAYAEHDTATIALFLSGAADGSKLCGFTLRGGHGLIGQGGYRFSAVFFADSCSPVICHNLITDNEADGQVVGNFYYCSGVFRGNHVFDNVFLQTALRVNYNLYWDPIIIEENTFGPNPRSENAQYPGIVLQPASRALISHNVFRGITGFGDLAVSANHVSEVTITHNIFDSLIAHADAASIISPVVWGYEVGGVLNVTDNIFSNLQIEEGAVLMVAGGGDIRDLLLEGNTFDNIVVMGVPTASNPTCVHIEGYSGAIRNNIFRANYGAHTGAVYVGSDGVGFPPAGIAFEHNLFEACSTFSPSFAAACITRSAYDGPITAHYNILRYNYPRAVGLDALLSAEIADFTLNYWGDPSGPYHPTLNPDGLGDVVGDSVLFDPWLTDSLIDEAGERLPPLPEKFSLESYPNPFNPETKLRLTVPEPGRYRIELYDLVGRRVRAIWEGAVVIDRELVFQAGGLASGVYFAQVSESFSSRQVAVTKLVLLK